MGGRNRYLVDRDEVFSSSTAAMAFVEETELFLCRFFQRLDFTDCTLQQHLTCSSVFPIN